MNTFLKTTGIIVIVALLWLVLVNLHSSGQVLLVENKAIQLNTALLIALVAIASAISTFCLQYGNVAELKKMLNKHARTAEKTSISSEESSDKIKQLQAKVDTLEIALKAALKKG